LTNQFFVWALGEVPFQTYTAWPINDASNTLKRVAAEAASALNPVLQKIDGTTMMWLPKHQQLVWSKLQMIGPYLKAAPQGQGQYLLGGLFPWTRGKNLAPQELWQQFSDRPNLVFYDWELSGMRLQQWRLLSQLLPILPANEPFNPSFVKSLSTARNRILPQSIDENWLAGLASMLGIAETVTEVSRTAPNQLTFIRSSPIGLTGFEMILLSHRLSGVGSGPIDMRLLPPRAKVSGLGAGH
jgi:hypothetical protein